MAKRKNSKIAYNWKKDKKDNLPNGKEDSNVLEDFERELLGDDFGILEGMNFGDK